MTIPPEVALSALFSLIGIAIIAFIWFGPRRWLVTDWGRNEMFAAREKLFDAAAAGLVSFDDPNYRRVREAINANIRFAHALSAIRLAMHMAAWARAGERAISVDPREAADRIADEKARAVAHDSLDRVRHMALYMLLFRSPMLFLAVFIFIGVPKLCVAFFRRAKTTDFMGEKLRQMSDAIQAEALAAG